MDSLLSEKMPTIMQIVGNAESKINFETGLKIKLIVVNESEPVDFKKIKKEVVANFCQIWEVEPNYVINKDRHKDKICMRALMFHFLRIKYKMTFREIGELNGSDHTTVIHNINSVDSWLMTRDEFTQPYYNKIKHLYNEHK